MDVADLCATCGAPMASDQRYCLECGSRRSTIGSGSLGGSHTSELGSDLVAGHGAAASGSVSSAGLASSSGLAFGTGPGSAGESHGQWTNHAVPAQAPGGVDPNATAPEAVSPRSGGPTAAIAGVGVLLLSMGVGVLIGRAGSDGTGKAATPPAQVISVASSPGAATATTPTTSTPRSTAPTKASAHKASKAASEVGQVPSKPAPPTVLEHLRSGSGQSYEQKSKNLPNVVSTG
jgi:hypothetical protein